MRWREVLTPTPVRISTPFEAQFPNRRTLGQPGSVFQYAPHPGTEGVASIPGRDTYVGGTLEPRSRAWRNPNPVESPARNHGGSRRSKREASQTTGPGAMVCHRRPGKYATVGVAIVTGRVRAGPRSRSGSGQTVFPIRRLVQGGGGSRRLGPGRPSLRGRGRGNQLIPRPTLGAMPSLVYQSTIAVAWT